MDESTAIILAAVITGIVSPIISFKVKDFLDSRSYPKADKIRINCLNGTWVGKFKQYISENEYKEIEINAELKRRMRKVSGKATYDFLDGKATKLSLYDGLFDGSILKIQYVGNLGVFHKGSIILEMNPNGDKLIGKFIGYSPNYKMIINGDINMVKK